ncbi:hypothetical protein PHLGIDRAFT_127017 [Phlebiopsis gigantea 11061_1 CR5-6]|uniref:Uncharacterized protein n=1 Tax=Phlebiopsis gigantea (strain 11061_1 CR5-6) TaxID=745531 RepID=A0A0C3S9K9_PHLG1|nr:hypothetical protein PHLGIDRAFT_127017 [Phlebiopsis gigantea 11061_1 CR5-6]
MQGISQGSSSSHLASGLAGGAAVLVGGYAWYHFSGTKQTLQTANSAHEYYQKAKSSIAEKAPKNPNEILDFLRTVTKQYAGVVPGASKYVDETFDAIDHLRDTHGEEFERILQETYDDVTHVLEEVKDKGVQGMDAATAGKLTNVVTKRLSELNELGKKVGGDALGKLEQSYPQIANTLGTSWSELKGLAERSGPEAKKMVDDTVTQLQDIMSKSKSMPDALNRAREVAQEKAQQVKETVWSAAEKEVESNPELKKLLNENKGAFIAAGSSLGSLGEVIERVKQVAKNGGDKQKIKELSEFIQDKVKESQGRGWEGLQSWVKSMPGGEEALKNLSDVDVQALIALSQSKGQDAKQLAEETYKDVLSLLKEKAGKAKKIADEGKDEAKSKAKSS